MGGQQGTHYIRYLINLHGIKQQQIGAYRSVVSCVVVVVVVAGVKQD